MIEKTLVFSHSLHLHLRVFAFLLNFFSASAQVSFILLSLPKQSDFADPQIEREGKSAQASTWGSSLADDCKVSWMCGCW